MDVWGNLLDRGCVCVGEASDEEVYCFEESGDVGFGEVARGMDLGMLLGGVRFLEVQTLSFLLIFCKQW